VAVATPSDKTSRRVMPGEVGSDMGTIVARTGAHR
jgi:hypothetical protein